jgi:HEAT repeat protein
MIKKIFISLLLGLTTPSLVAEDIREAALDLTKKAATSGFNRILYLMQAGNTGTALKVYQEYFEKEGQHDLELVQNIGLILLDQGFKSDDEESQLLTLFGAGISMNERAIYILEEGMRSRNPQLQYISMNELARLQNDGADEALKRAMGSNYLLIRLECLYHLAEKKVPSAAHYAEALMSKVDSSLLPMFPQYFAMIGDDDAIKVLRKLLNNPKENVRVEAVLSATKHGRDDLLPTIRTLATHHLMVQQEACAVCLGVLKDEVSVPKLESMLHSGCPTVRLAATHALFRLGRHELRAQIEEAAKASDLFAITLLGDMPGSEDLLVELIKSQNIQVRVNATLALLKRQDARCLYPLAEILVRDSRDLAFTKVHSPSKAMFSYKVVPSARQNFREDLIPYEVSLGIRENTLEQSSELPEKDFISLANMLFENQQHDLIPTLVRILESLHTPEAINLLKKHQQKAGAPLIRNYCNLALYRLKEEGPYADNLKAWVAVQQGEDFIFRPLIPWEMRDASGPYQLTPQEKSRLLIESCQALTQSQDDFGVSVLLHVIQNGNSKNKYALAGLLIRAAQ